MKSAKAEKEFRKFVENHGLAIERLTPYLALDAMFAFYREIPASDCLECEQDMLLFQWGTYDWGKGRHFEIDITRQFIRGEGEDDDIWQLSLTVRVPPEPALEALERGHRWCQCREDLELFQGFVAASAAFKAVGQREDGRTELRFGCAG